MWTVPGSHRRAVNGANREEGGNDDDRAAIHLRDLDFLLIQDRQDPHRFISFGAWDDWASADEWRASEAFADRMGACRELCEDFRPNDSTLRAAIGT